MKHIIPHLWFAAEAKEASQLYVSIFPDSKVTHASVIRDTPSGDCDLISFELAGQPFMAISAGPYFTLNPSISFLVNFDPSVFSDARERLDAAWEKLTDGGTVMMPLQEYPFSKRYGWVQDRYGVSWQLMLTNPSGDPRPFITPSMLFTQEKAGRAEEAIDFYCSIFPHSVRGLTARYPEGSTPDVPGTIMYADFQILNTWIAAMDSAGAHAFTFNEACSLIVPCDTQEEIDYYWEKLSAVPEAEQCGWLKDKFGVSWQITSSDMDTMMRTGTKEQVARLTKAFLAMKKFDIAKLEEAFTGS